VLPMLAQAAETWLRRSKELGAALLEWKLDGARIQVHKSGGEVRVFTRNSERCHRAVPEVVSALKDVPSL
jgi:DNA ligase-1